MPLPAENGTRLVGFMQPIWSEICFDRPITTDVEHVEVSYDATVAVAALSISPVVGSTPHDATSPRPITVVCNPIRANRVAPDGNVAESRARLMVPQSSASPGPAPPDDEQ